MIKLREENTTAFTYKSIISKDFWFLGIIAIPAVIFILFYSLYPGAIFQSLGVTVTSSNQLAQASANTFIPRVYYVDGSDQGSRNDGSYAEPFMTIQQGIDQLRPGDTLVVRPGVYREVVTIEDFGDPDKLTVITSEQPGSVFIDAVDYTRHTADRKTVHRDNTFYAIGILDSQGVRLSGFIVGDEERGILGSRGFGIYVGSKQFTSPDAFSISRENIQLTDNRTYATGQSGIFVRGVKDVKLLRNEVQRAVQIAFQESVTLSTVQNFEVAYNLVHDRPITTPDGPVVESLFKDYITRDPFLFTNGQPRNPDGIVIRGAADGGEAIDVKGAYRTGVYHNNIVDGIQDKFAFYTDAWDKSAGNLTMYNNIAMNSGCAFVLSVENGRVGDGALLNEVEIYNNIAYQNSCGLYMGYHGGKASGEPYRPIENVTVRNNLFVGNDGGGITVLNPDVSGVAFRNNVIGANDGWQIVTKNRKTSVAQHLADGRLMISDNFILGNGDRTFQDNVVGSNTFMPSSETVTFTGDSLSNDVGFEFPAYNSLAGLTRDAEGLLDRLREYQSGDKRSWMYIDTSFEYVPMPRSIRVGNRTSDSSIADQADAANLTDVTDPDYRSYGVDLNDSNAVTTNYPAGLEIIIIDPARVLASPGGRAIGLAQAGATGMLGTDTIEVDGSSYNFVEFRKDFSGYVDSSLFELNQASEFSESVSSAENSTSDTMTADPNMQLSADEIDNLNNSYTEDPNDIEVSDSLSGSDAKKEVITLRQVYVLESPGGRAIGIAQAGSVGTVLDEAYSEFDGTYWQYIGFASGLTGFIQVSDLVEN